MPSHHHGQKQHLPDVNRHEKKGPGKGPEETEIAAALTATTVAFAGNGIVYPTLDAAGAAVAEMYARMFDFVAPVRPQA